MTACSPRMGGSRRGIEEASGARLAVDPVVGGVEPLASIALWPWVLLASQHELSVGQLAEGLGVPVAQLRDPGARFSQDVGNRLAEMVYERAGPGAAMHAAVMVEAGHFALFELLARTSPTVGEALVLACQYFPLLHRDVRLVHEVRADEVQVMRVTLPEYPTHHGYVELAFAAWVLALRRETRDEGFAPAAAWFGHQVPAGARAAFEAVLGPHVRFGMPEAQLQFSPEASALRLARENADVHAEALRAAADLIRS